MGTNNIKSLYSIFWKLIATFHRCFKKSSSENVRKNICEKLFWIHFFMKSLQDCSTVINLYQNKNVKKQVWLFKYGFIKRIHYRDTLLNVSVGDYVAETGTCNGCSCNKSFMLKQGLPSHVSWPNPAGVSINNQKAL